MREHDHDREELDETHRPGVEVQCVSDLRSAFKELGPNLKMLLGLRIYQVGARNRWAWMVGNLVVMDNASRGAPPRD